MDNLTHSLIGLVAGDAVAHATRTRGGALSAGARRGLFVTLAAVGGNLPDADLILPYARGSRDKISYLLEHRGYTHTVIGCVLLALLLYACAEGWARYKKYALTWSDRCALFGMALLGTMLHLLMDFLNSYGVHPFWPFDNRWVYGDSVFIIEPIYWIAAAPMFFVVRTWLARVAVAVATVLAVGLAGFAHPGQWIWIAAIFLLAVALFVLGRRGSVRRNALTSAGLMIAVTASFAGAGRVASSEVETLAAKAFPSEQLVDHVLSPQPMNPFCWDVLLIQRATAQGTFSVRHGMVSTLPTLIPARACPRIFDGRAGGTAPLAPVASASSRVVLWFGEFSMETSRLAAVAAADCEAQALMQFVRAPFATRVGQKWVLGDLRFDRERGLSMAEVEVDSAAAAGSRTCRVRAPWVPPRLDLLAKPQP